MMPVNIANVMTIVRMLSVPFFISAIVYYHPQADYLRYVALAIFLLAIVTDVFDGYLARVYHQDTKIGAILDPLADKLLLMSAFICLYRVPDITGPAVVPLWILLIVISRDAILLLGGAAIHMTCGGIDVKPSRIGRMTAFFQVVSIIAALTRLPLFPSLWYIVGLLSVVSGIDYLRQGVKVLNDHNR